MHTREPWDRANEEERDVLAQLIQHLPGLEAAGDSPLIATICTLQELVKQLTIEFSEGSDGAKVLAALYGTCVIAANGLELDIETLGQRLYDEATA